MVTEERCTSRRRGKREGNKNREKNFLKHKIPIKQAEQFCKTKVCTNVYAFGVTQFSQSANKSNC